MSVVSVVSGVLVLSEAVVSSVVDVSDDSPTVAVVSELPILVELEVSDKVIVVRTADMVTSVVDPPPLPSPWLPGQIAQLRWTRT